jgi:hypothetical protein
MPALAIVLVVLLGALTVRAAVSNLSTPTLSSLDANIPPHLGQAVLRAYETETDSSMRLAFSQALIGGGYPKAGNLLAKKA